MWNFVSGVKRPDPPNSKPPPKKPREEKQKNYDSERHFKASRKYAADGTERFWLVYNKETGLIGCSVCRDHARGAGSDSNFVKCIAE